MLDVSETGAEACKRCYIGFNSHIGSTEGVSDAMGTISSIDTSKFTRFAGFLLAHNCVEGL